MQTNIEMEFKYAYNAWEANHKLDKQTIADLKKCYGRTPGSEIDRAAQNYPVEFMEYIDFCMREQ